MERLKVLVLIPVLLLALGNRLEVVFALNDEGLALLRFREGIEIDPYGSLLSWEQEEDVGNPCSWTGVYCEDGRVVSLDLQNLCLTGILSPELGKLIHLKYLVLYNNSFYGTVPREIGGLEKLEILNLGCNNISGPLPLDLGNLLSLETLVISGNPFLGSLSPELLRLITDIHVDDNLSTTSGRYVSRNMGNATIRRLLQLKDLPENVTGSYEAASPPSSPSPSPVSPSPSPTSPSDLSPPPGDQDDRRSPSGPPATNQSPSSDKRVHTFVYVLVAVGACFIVLASIYFFLFHVKKGGAVKPWATGLSGQLQKAFVTGVPALKPSELQTACEDFSNIIGSISDGTLYKGTLSSGVEIAVNVIKTDKGWSKLSEAQFRRKIATLSKFNHKNFVNLLGYSEEEPYTRMMVFEYAPNGKLFEHLHVKDSQDLDWGARLRIAMGVAYCVDHMHQLDPPIVLEDLSSNMIYLTDDFAAKIADMRLWSATIEHGTSSGHLHGPTPEQASIVHKFGVLLLELISGRPPYSEETGGLVNWASDFLKGTRPARDMVDTSLRSFREEDINPLFHVAKLCLNPNPMERPSMNEVAAQLREITSITPDGAAPKLSPLWWAELEIISTEAS